MVTGQSQRFGDLLRLRRLTMRLTQVQLADRAGLSRRGIQDLERGINLPRADTLNLLIEALQLTGPERNHFVAAALQGDATRPRSPGGPPGVQERPRDELGPALQAPSFPSERSSPTTNAKLRAAREGRAYSRSDLANRVGVDAKTVQEWEERGEVPDPDMIETLCHVLGATRDEIGYRQDIYHERHSRGLSLQEVVAGLNLLVAPADRPSFLTQREYERIEGGTPPSPSWEWIIRRFFGDIGSEPFGLAPAKTARIGRFEEIDILRKYLSELVELYGKLKLPIGPAQGFSLAAVFQPLRLHHPSENDGFYRFRDDLVFDDSGFDRSEPDNSADLSNESVAEDGFRAIEKSAELSGKPYRRIAVLGGPGCGKSTLLKHFVAHQARVILDRIDSARGRFLHRDGGDLIPVFVSLPELARSGRTLKEFISTTLQNMFVDERFAEFLWECIEQGRAFVCLDSLDEVMTGRAEMIRTLNTLMRGSHEATVWVVSSRFTEYKGGQFLLGHLTEWELLPLDHPLRRRLSHRLIPEIQGLMPGSQPSDPDAFLQAVERHTRIASWGRNPLLLSLAAILYVRRGTMPDSRRELYLQVLDAIVELREPSLNIVAREMLVEMTAFISYKLFMQRTGRHFSATDLVRLLRVFQDESGADWHHIERLGWSLINTGIIEMVGANTFTFLHQTFQEYLAAYYISRVSRERATGAIRELMDNIGEQFVRQLIIELTHIVHQHDIELETELYGATIGRFRRAKEQILDGVSQEGRAELSAVIGAIDTCLIALVDLWAARYCDSLDAGSAANRGEVELASSIAAVFERVPRPIAAPALIRGLHKYPKKARFLGALGRIATPDAGQAILAFAKEQLAALTDPGVLLYVVGALGDARLSEAVSILGAIRDDTTLDLDVRIEAHNVLANIGEPSTFDEAMVYSLPRIQRGLLVEDDQGRPADWKRLRRYSEWLPEHMSHEMLRPHYDEILRALENALSHPHDLARVPIVVSLGRVGNSATFSKLLSMLERGEASGDLAEKTLVALRHLVERRQFPLTDNQLDQAIAPIQRHYPYLHDEVELLRQHNQEAVRDPPRPL